MTSGNRKLTLIYFNLAGRAEPSRLAAVAGGVAFTNRVVEREEFPALKDELPLGQLPVLEIEREGRQKTVIPHSDDILRYFGKLGGLYPVDPVDALKVDALLSTMNDFVAPLVVSFSGFKQSLLSDEEMSEKDKLAIRARVVSNFVPKYFGYIEKILEDNGTGWLVGSAMTIADLKVSNGVEWMTSGILDGISPDCLQNFPLTLALMKRVKSVPAIAAWYKQKGDKPYSSSDYIPQD